MKRFLFLLCLSLTTGFSFAQQLAFPGAEGFGKYAVGGRNGTVYHVTNLNDSGSGSLRDAVSQSNRIVVFDVAGVINLNSRLVFSSNLYVAGQTAPGEGIIVYGDGVSFSGASNTIVRYMRFRCGKGGTSDCDAAGIANGTNMIFDHLSVSWGLDETFSISSDGKGDLGDITIQNTIIGQGLLSHSAGGLIQADHITLYRNLYIDNGTRNAKIKGTNQYVNNMVYNWKSAAYIMGGGSTGDAYCNAVGNLFIKGPAGGGTPFSGGNANFHLYAEDNWYDSSLDGTLNPYLIPQSEYSGPPAFQTAPYDYPKLPTTEANNLIDELLPTVGANIPYRDFVDHYMVDEVLSYGTIGRLLSEESQLPFGVPSSWSLWSGNDREDSDGDGMPDDWENSNGTNASLNDAMVISTNGYANIENYINSLTINDRDFFLRAPVCFSLEESTSSTLLLGWYDYTEEEQGFAIEMQKEGSFVEVARTKAGENSVLLTGLEPATAYTLRARAFTGTSIFSDYTQTLTVKTQPEEVELVDPLTYTPDFTWNGDDDAWDTESPNWNNGIAYSDGGKVLFEPLTDITVTLDETVSPASIVVRDDGALTLSGNGSISGAGSLNKAGEGVLTLNTTNSYTGATVVRGGTVSFSSLKDGGVNSNIGASQEFAQNWVWYGGTWDYTGTSTSTNRSAIIYKDTELNIANSGATVTLNGTLEGVGGMILNGEGQLTINQPFAYEGATTLKGGTLYLSGSTMVDAGLGTSPKLVMAGGTFKTKDSNDRYGVYSFPIEVQEGTYSTLYVHRNCSIESKVSGAGTLEYQVNYLREYVTGDWSDFTGRLVANGVAATSGQETQLMLFNGVGIPNAVVETRGTTRIVSWKAASTYYLGGLSGTATTYLSGSSKNTDNTTMTWIVGGANTDETFRGIIDNRCSASGHNAKTYIVKEGEGVWRLTGANIYSGTTTVNEGKLVVNGTHSGTGAVTVNDGGTLCGVGTLAAKVTINSGGIVLGGDTVVSSTSTLKLNGGLAMNAGANLGVSLYRQQTLNKANKVVFKGSVSLNGNLYLDLSQVTIDMVPDSYFDIFDFSNATVTGTFTGVFPAVPQEGMVWDTSELYSKGRLYVRTDDTKIGAPALSETQIFPLVADDNISLMFPFSGEAVTVEILDMNGKSCYAVSAIDNLSINVASLSSGVYLIRLNSKGRETVKRFIKK